MIQIIQRLQNDQILILSDFVRRQTPTSGHSHFEGTEEELLTLVAGDFHHAKQGYRDGVVLVDVDPSQFMSGTCTLKEGDELRGIYTARAPGEVPRKAVGVVGGGKTPAQACQIVLYRSDVLAENDERTQPCIADWEIISINAQPTTEKAPIPLNALLHNHFGSSGGTATGLNDADFVALLRESFLYWKDKASPWTGPNSCD